MSIFKHHNIDAILLQFLDIGDLKNLYQINKHYKGLISPLLKPFIEFYQNINTFKLPFWINDDILFNRAIVCGDLQICKYLIKKYKVKNINHLFQLSCENGHLEIAKWLFSLGINHNVHNDDAFRGACANGHLEIAKWLFSLGVNHNAGNDCAFRWSCANGHLEVAKWLFSLGVNHNAGEDFPFQYSCINGYLEVATWLCSIEPRYHISVIDRKIKYTID